jgi:hypothetical protein
MSAPNFDPSPPQPSRRRSARMWIALFMVWTLGLASFLLWLLILFYMLIRLLA